MTQSTTFEVEICCTCGLQFAVHEEFNKKRRNDHKAFYCPVGHGQYYAGESNEEKLRRERDSAKQQIARAEDEAREAKAAAERAQQEAKRLKKRAAAATCPCCQRSFSNVRAHLNNKHPEFVAENVVSIKKKA